MVKYAKFPFYGKPRFDFWKEIQTVLSANFIAIDFMLIFINDFNIKSF